MAKFEDVLARIGDEGRFQWATIALLLLPTSLLTAFHESIVHMATPDHWCRVPQLQHLPDDVQHRLIRPIEIANISDQTRSNCFRYDLDYDRIQSIDDFEQIVQSLRNRTTNDSSSSDAEIPIVKCSHGWQYDRSLYSETAITWFDLVCDRDNYLHIVISLSLIGLVAITPILTNLSDRIGRRKTMLITFVILEIACLNPLLTKDMYTFIGARIIAGGTVSSFYQIPFVLTQEVVSQGYRTKASFLSALFYSFGNCLAPLVAKLSGNWVNFAAVQFVSTLPFLLFFRYIPDSPEWLISAGKLSEAEKELARIAKINKRPKLLKQDLQSLKCEDDDNQGNDELHQDALAVSERIPEPEPKSEPEPEPDQKPDHFIALFTMPGLRFKMFAVTLVFVACLVAYGGLSFNTINLEAESQLYNFLYLSAIDIPALLLFWRLLDTRFGRRWTSVFGMTICGVALLVPAAVSAISSQIFGDIEFYRTSNLNSACAVVAKFGIAGTYMVIYQQASELFPTTLRNQGIGIATTISSVIEIGVPQLIYLSKYGEWIVFAIIGTVSLFAAIVASFLPETLNEYLPERASDSAKFGLDRPYFCLATMQSSDEPDDQNQNKKTKQNNDIEKNITVIN